MAEPIGALFVRKNIITEDQLETALQEQANTGEFLGEILIRLGFLNEEALLTALAEQFNTKFVRLGNVRINPQAVKAVPKNMAWEYKIMPIEIRAAVLLIAISNPLNVWPLSDLQEKADVLEVQIVLATKQDILQSIRKHYGSESGY